ncbi:MAG: hypothetical protein AB7Q42_23415 [Acidimicrobiia bacterium]
MTTALPPRARRRSGARSTLAATALLAACAGADTSGAADVLDVDGSAGIETTTSSAPPPPIPEYVEIEFDAANFTDPTTIDNPFFPLVPGTQMVFEGEANRGGGQLTHRVIITVTDLTKVIDGVRTVVVWERDVNEGQQVETELAFFAQDDDGNVWNLGEYPEEYESRAFAGAPSTWISGQPGADGGIHVQGNPQLGTPIYLEGRVPAIEFLDVAQISAMDEQTCIPLDCYEGALVIDEWDPLAQPEDGHQLKTYAPDIGVVRVDALGGDEQEALVLAELIRLDTSQLAEVRDAALRLDQRAYQYAPRIYGVTAPIQPP